MIKLPVSFKCPVENFQSYNKDVVMTNGDLDALHI